MLSPGRNAEASLAGRLASDFPFWGVAVRGLGVLGLGVRVLRFFVFKAEEGGGERGKGYVRVSGEGFRVWPFGPVN